MTPEVVRGCVQSDLTHPRAPASASRRVITSGVAGAVIPFSDDRDRRARRRFGTHRATCWGGHRADRRRSAFGIEMTPPMAARPSPVRRRSPSASAELQELNVVPPALTSGTVIGQVGVDGVGAGIEIVSFRSLAGSLDPSLFCRELLTLGPGGEFVSFGLLPLCFKVPSSRVVAVVLRLAPPLIGLDGGPTPHDDDSTRHDGDSNDNDHDDDDSSHVDETYTSCGFTMATTLHVLLDH